MPRNPWCSESSTRWVSSTSGKSSVRKGIRDSLKQTKKIALQIREKEEYTKSLVSVDLSKHGMKNFPGLNLTRSKITCFVQFAKNIPLFVTRVAAFLGYWRFIIYLFSSWHLSQPQPFCFGSFFFFGRVDFAFGRPKSAKYLSDGQVKWKKGFALPTSNLTSLMTIWVSTRVDLVPTFFSM